MIQEKLAKQLQNHLEAYISKRTNHEEASLKQMLAEKRNAEIVKVKARANIISRQQYDEMVDVRYVVHYEYVFKQGKWFYIEEESEQRQAKFCEQQLMEDEKILPSWQVNEMYAVEDSTERIEESLAIAHSEREYFGEEMERVSYKYNRLAVVKYAETWWNSYNPTYKHFDVDCTNFVSQCLHTGGVPMSGYPNKTKGWWIRGGDWSYSWTVANSFRLFLNKGLATVVKSPEQLTFGDVICYDFEGDGRYNHSTIVVAKDKEQMPLVNAHTMNSRMRYWSYEDSTAYTKNIKYQFFHIVDGR